MGVNLGFDSPETAEKTLAGLAPIDPSKIMDEIARLTPHWAGVSYERLDKLGFLQWPCPSKDHPGTDIVHKDGNFLRGKAKLTVTPWQEPGELPDEQYPLMLTTGRQLFHYNVGTMTRRTDVSKLQKAKEETLRIHPSDARELDIRTGDLVDVTSRRGTVRVRAEVTRATNPGILFMTFHFPESRTNILISGACDEYTGCPEYKVCAVRLAKADKADEPADQSALGAHLEAMVYRSPNG
jgi:predicted molibdopterin-dependent oxidoreductase YjgC